MTPPGTIPKDLAALAFLPTAEALFDSLPDVVFFVKNRDARYVTVNQTLVQRCGVDSKDDILGKRTLDIFTSPHAEAYYEQDQRVLSEGVTIKDQLELHLYLRGGPGWCVTTKMPLHDTTGTPIGIVGVSNDIHAPATEESGYREVARAVSYIKEHVGEGLRVDALADLCGLSVYQFEERMKRIFHLTAGQFISKTRIETARRMLMQEAAPVVDIALACGFSDQSAFTRQFKATTSYTPTEYRRSASSRDR